MSFSFCCHDSLLKGHVTARKLNLATCLVYGVHHTTPGGGSLSALAAKIILKVAGKKAIRPGIFTALQHIPDTGFRMIRYYGFLATRVRSKLLPTVYDLLEQLERKAIPIRFPAMMKSSFGIDPLECILCKSRMALTGIVPGKNMAGLRQCHERLALNRPIALV